MRLEEEQLPEFIKELRNLLGSIKGAVGLNETFSLSYVVVVDSEESKENVLKVGNMLTEQAAQSHGIDLEIVPATQDEINEAAEALRKMRETSEGSFVL